MEDAQKATPPAAAAPAPKGRIPERLTLLFALGVPALIFFSKIASSGIWDPYELNVADLARRVAVNAFGAAQLALGGGDNSMPRLGDLGRNELPFDSIALGFRLFGLHEWSGRLPLALWALAGVLALYLALARLADKKAGMYGAFVLATMPLYFIQARTMLGDIVTMAAISIAFFGLAVAVFDRPGPGEDGKKVARGRVVGLVAGLLGLGAGFLCRGLLVGVALPALGIGVTWGVTWGAGKRAADRIGDVAGGLALTVGAVAAYVGTSALFRVAPSEYSMLVGATVSNQPKAPTFDFVVHYLGHALFPWSAFIPLAVGRLFREPPAPAGDDAEAAEARYRENAGEAATDASLAENVIERESALRLAIVVGSAIAFGVYSLMAPRTGYIAFGAPAILAAIAALTIRDFERGAPSSRAIAVGVAVLAALFLRDFNMFPEKGLSAFAVASTTFPDSFKDEASKLILLSSAAFVGIIFLSWMERGSPELDKDEYLAWPRTLSRAWDGNLLFGLIVLEVALAGAGLAVYLGLHVFHWKQVMALGVPARIIALNSFWALPIGAIGCVWAIMAARDAFRWLLRTSGISRGFATVIGGVVVGALLSFVYYPALAAQLSPKDVFDAYAKMHKAGEPLGLLGVGGRSASYYSGGEVKMLTDVTSAYQWLTQSPERRWLLVRNDDLGKLNSLFRTRPGPKKNLPVLDAKSSQILLVSNQIAPGETNQSPYNSIVLDEDPQPQNRFEANLQDSLVCLGWDVWDAAGKTRVDAVTPARKYRFRIYYKVTGQISGEWETFIHIDGYHRRFNGDHKTLGGKYSLSLWQPGDYIVDDYEFSLEPNFTPGNYNVFYGLFVGDNRMKVKSGKADDNRIEAGFIRVQ